MNGLSGNPCRHSANGPLAGLQVLERQAVRPHPTAVPSSDISVDLLVVFVGRVASVRRASRRAGRHRCTEHLARGSGVIHVTVRRERATVRRPFVDPVDATSGATSLGRCGSAFPCPPTASGTPCGPPRNRRDVRGGTVTATDRPSPPSAGRRRRRTGRRSPSSPEFQELRRRFRSFAFPMTGPSWPGTCCSCCSRPTRTTSWRPRFRQRQRRAAAGPGAVRVDVPDHHALRPARRAEHRPHRRRDARALEAHEFGTPRREEPTVVDLLAAGPGPASRPSTSRSSASSS